MTESIRDILSDAFDDNGEFHAINFLRALTREGYRSLAPREDNGGYATDKIHAFAAAIEYYDGDIEQARATIERGEYRHCPDAQTYEDLGWEILREETNVDRLPQIVCDYMDFESLGSDAECGEQGQFTRFGYFAPEKW